MVLAITETIFIPLLDEGTDVARPTQGEHLENGTFRVLPTPRYNPEDEAWQFVPGSIVHCVRKITSAGSVLMAERLYTVDNESK